MTRHRAHLLSWAALAFGLAVLAATIWLLDFDVVRAETRRLGYALPLVLLASGAWHLARTVAWAACFPKPGVVPFWRLARVRLAAEAFSYLTLRGIAGEPLKVLMLDREVDARDATAAVALERMAYLAITTVIVGIGAVMAIVALPLSRVWFRVFRAFAICAGVVVVLSAIVISGRGTYLGWMESRWGRAGRFAAAVERQLLEVVRHNPRRLMVVVAMSFICYVTMALEVWVVLRAAGARPGFDAAVAVETFSRVASFAASFVPANLGVLEASSVAAVAAIGIASGGAALAIARRIRGLFWAAAGLLVYPRPKAHHHHGTGGVLLYIAAADAADVSVFGRVAGLSIAERVFLAARRHGFDRVILDASGREERLALSARRAGLAIMMPKDEGRRPNVAASANGTTPFSVEHGYIPRPGGSALEMLSTRVLARTDLPAAEREIRAAVFKPSDRNVAAFNRRMSLPVSVALIRAPITANQFSIGLLFLGLYSAWLFSIGSYATGVAGAAVSLAAGILDGCDGEIARLKYQESAFGAWLETITDYTYYFAIFAGLTVGTARRTGWPGTYWLGGIALGGMAISFLLLLYLRHRVNRQTNENFARAVKGRFKEGGAAWTRWLGRLAYAATRAQMPYGILALALLNALPLVLVLCVIGANTYWIAMLVRFRTLAGEETAPLHPPALAS
jgi:phosphatidylglycerophosphate synthase